MKRIFIIPLLFFCAFVEAQNTHITGNRAANIFYTDDWGLKPDSSADCLAPMNKLLAFVPDGSTIMFGVGKYWFSDSVLVKKSIRFIGQGESLGSQFLGARKGGTFIYGGSGSKSVFAIDSAVDYKPLVSFEHFTLQYNGGSAPTAGAGIVYRGFTQRFYIDHCTIDGFYIDVDIVSGFYWTISNCWIGSPIRSAVRCSDTQRIDTGDWGIFNCQFISAATAGTAKGIEWVAGGGLRISGCKFDAQSFTVNTQFVYAIWISDLLGSTSDIQIDHVSIEDYQNTGIYDSVPSGNRIAHHLFTNIQIAGVGSLKPAIVAVNCKGLVMTGYTLTDWAGNAGTAMQFNNCVGVDVSDGFIYGFASPYTQSGSIMSKMHYNFSALNPDATGVFKESTLLQTDEAASGYTIDLYNSNNNSFAQTAISFYDEGGIAHAGKGGSLFHYGGGTAWPYLHAFGMWNYDKGPVWFATNNTNRGGIDSSGDWLVGTNTTSNGARLQIAAATATKVPLSIATSTLISGRVAGGFENDGSQLYFTPGGTRYRVTNQIAASLGQVVLGDGQGAGIGETFFTADTTNKRVTIGTGTINFPVDLNISRATTGATDIGMENTNTAGTAELFFAEGAADFGGVGRKNSAATGNWAGTSIPNAYSAYIYTLSAGTQGAKPIVLSGTPVYAIPGQTAANNGFSQDATGFHIGAISGLNSANTARFQVSANTATIPQMLLDGAAVDVTSPTNGMLWYNSTAHSLNFRDNGVTTNLLAATTPTLQQVLTSGSTLTQDNTISYTTHNLIFNTNGSLVQQNTAGTFSYGSVLNPISGNGHYGFGYITPPLSGYNHGYVDYDSLMNVTFPSNISVAGNFSLTTLGQAFKLVEGSDGRVGQTSLTSGTKAISVSGLTTSSRAFVTLVSQAGTTTTTTAYIAVCTSNTITISAVTNAGVNTVNTLDTSTLNYFIVN